MPNVSLGPAFETFVETQVREGRFQNASEVVRAGLRLLQEHELDVAERRSRLTQSINAAFDTGGVDVSDHDVFRRLEDQFQRDLEARRDGV
jgi:antitoxin ParD1/3/4